MIPLYLLLVLVILVALKIYIHRVEYKIKKRGRVVLVNDTVVEVADLQHYIQTKKNYNRDIVLNPIVDITENDYDIDIPDIIAYHIDNQNVHETSVQSNVKNTFNKVAKSSQPLDFEDIFNHIQEDKQEEVMEIIQKIIDRNAYVTNVESTEEDILKNIWFNADPNIKTQMVKMLLECVDEKGNLYCPTGVVTRLTSALHINNPDNHPKSKELLNQEVMATFGKFFNELEDKGLARQRTIDSYSNVYDSNVITNLIDQWLPFI